nr:hypothetical protein [Thermoleophilaceae bacterium]
VDDFMHPDRVVVGANDGSEQFADRVETLYAPLGGVMVRTDVASAEMVKLASNAFLATKISFINEIANVSEDLGADVREVARGMGLDDRIGPKFLQAGIGYGGSCLAGDETVLVRHRGRTTLVTFARLWDHLEEDCGEVAEGVIEPDGLEVMSWVPGSEAPRFMPVMAATRREYEGDLIEVRTKMGRRVRSTPDHPWLAADGTSDEVTVKPAGALTSDDWLPIAQGRSDQGDAVPMLSLASAVEAAGLTAGEVVVRPPVDRLETITSRPMAERREIFASHRSPAARTGDVKRTGTLRLDELARAGLPLAQSTFGTARNGQFVNTEIAADEAFWRTVGLYLAEGHVSVEPGRTGMRHRIHWSFHPRHEEHLVDEVMSFWLRHGVNARSSHGSTARTVSVSSRLLGSWWVTELGLGRNSYEQRLPDLIWERPDGDKWALLSGLWEGDGSWSAIAGGPSVVLEMGTVSDELADGTLRLLGDLGMVGGHRVGRVAKSTKDTHWIRISGAAQVERAMRLVPDRDRDGVRSLIARQAKRIAPTGYRRFDGQGWARVTCAARQRFSGPVYSLEVPGAHTFVTTGGLTTHNCFPKDVQALKQLAGNTGYHFQLLTAVIEVNELQKRRTIGKLQKHLGSLVGKEIALLGVAFKPNTDDIREATSLVLAGRLQGEGASVRVYDPVATDRAAEQLGGATVAATALEAVDGADAVVLV